MFHKASWQPYFTDASKEDGKSKSKEIIILIIFLVALGTAGLSLIFYGLSEGESECKPKENQTFRFDSKEKELLEKWNTSEWTAMEKADELLEMYPVIDTHNAFLDNLKEVTLNDLEQVKFDSDLRTMEPWGSLNVSHTDIPRLKKGRVGAQWWVASTNCDAQGRDAVTQTLEQIDIIMRLVDRYPNDLEFCDNSECIARVSRKGKIASLIGIKGGHSIDSSAAVLRQFHKLGVRYMSLTHDCHTPWADAASMADPVNNGISPFGLGIVDEMNRIGMIIDLSLASKGAIEKVLEKSKAPVIFSHSAVRHSHVCEDDDKNLSDDLLHRLKRNNGLIMISFPNVLCYKNANVTLDDVVRHFEYVRKLIGAEHLGIGAAYDGHYITPVGLEDVSTYPNLFAKLIEKGWSFDELKKIAFENMMRLMKKVELVSEKWSKRLAPMQSIMSTAEIRSKNFLEIDFCRSSSSLGLMLQEKQEDEPFVETK